MDCNVWTSILVADISDFLLRLKEFLDEETFCKSSTPTLGSFKCLFAGMFSATRCGIQRYRMEKDWVNASVAGAVTGAALAARTRNWTHIFGSAIIVSAMTTVADYSTSTS